MSYALHGLILLINRHGEAYWNFAGPMFVQVTVLVAMLAVLDFALRHRVRAVVRCWIWLLVLAKLLMPTSAWTPASVAYWLPGSKLAAATAPPLAQNAIPEAAFDGLAPETPFESSTRPIDQASAISVRQTSSDQPPSIEPSADEKARAAAIPSINISAKGVAFVAWIIGVVVLLTMLAGRMLKVKALVDEAHSAPRELETLLIECLPLLGLRPDRMKLRISDRLGSPAICGLLRPTILLPNRGLERLDREQLRLIFLHELVHWKRGDLQLNCLQTLLQIAYFYNPAVWLAGAVIKRTREQAVDETVLVLRAGEAERYATTLIDLAAVSLRPAEAMLRLLGVVESRKALAGRIKRIIGRPIPRSAKLGLTGLAAIAAVGLLLLPMARPDRSQAVAETAAATKAKAAAKKETRKADGEKTESNAPPTGNPSDLSGRIVGEGEEGEPVTDAEVEIVYSHGGQPIQTQTDKDGRYRFDEVPRDGEYSLSIKSNAWIGFDSRDPRSHVDLTPGLPVVRNFALPRAARVRLEVVDEKGQPIQGVRVYSHLPSSPAFHVDNCGSTDKDGVLLAGDLKPSAEKRLIGLSHDHHAIGRLELVLDDPAVVPEKRVVLSAGHAVSGKLLCSDGKPASGWEISALPAWWTMGISPAGTTIANNGSFTLPHVGDGPYNVTVSIPTGNGTWTPRTILTDKTLPAGTSPLALKVDFPSPGAMTKITGEVEFVGPAPRRGIQVVARGGADFYGEVSPGETSFELGPVPAGTYSVNFHSTEIENLELPNVVVPSAKPLSVKITVHGQMKLAGSVVDGSGQPVRRFKVQVTKQRSRGTNFVQNRQWHDVASDTGTFAVDIVGPGIYTANVIAEGYAPASLRDIDTDAEAAKDLRISLSPGKKLTATVIDEQGDAIAGAKVTPFLTASGKPAGNADSSDINPAVTDAVGKFEIEHFAFDQEGLEINHPKFAPSSTPVVFSAIEGKALKITLRRGATLRGHVYDQDGKPVADAALHFHHKFYTLQGPDPRAPDLATATTDADGLYEARELSEEDWYVDRSESWNTWGVVRQIVHARNGRTQNVDFGGSARTTGRIMVNGQPLANNKLIVSGEYAHFGPLMARGQTDEQGNFVFLGIPPGRRTLYFDPPQAAGNPFPLRARQFDALREGNALGTIELTTADVTVRVAGLADIKEGKADLFLTEYPTNLRMGAIIGRPQLRRGPTDPWVYSYIPAGKYELVLKRPNGWFVHQVIDVTSAPEQSFELKSPAGTASLSGRCDRSIGRYGLHVWSKDFSLWNDVRPAEDGSYRLENIPAGEYTIRQNDNRDSEVLLEFSIAAGEQNTLEITPKNVASSSLPTGFRFLYTYTTEGVMLPGCEIEVAASTSPPKEKNRNEFRTLYMGDVGQKYQMTVSYPGFKPLTQTFELLPVGMGPPKGDSILRVFLEPE